MLSITESAMDLFHKSVKSLAPTPDTEKCIRLTPGRNSGLALTFEKPNDTDTTHTRGNRVVLAVPRKIDEMCRGKTLDMDESGHLTVR